MEMHGVTGESLGTIGQHQPQDPSGATTQLPEWKQALISKPSISVRKGIAWSYDPPYEDTSTLVLTAPSGIFVDVRFALHGDPTGLEGGVFWGFCGMSETTFPRGEAGGEMQYTGHTVFEHWVDSRGEGIVDEGDMFLLPNGDVAEVGIMRSPRGKDELYKEYWVGVEGMKSPCVLAEAEGRAGMVCRIGGFCQGVVKRKTKDGQREIEEEGGEVLVERWVRTEDVGGEDLDVADWIKDLRSNTGHGEQVDVAIPAMWVCGEKREEGDEIEVDGLKWRVVEVLK